MGLRKEKLAGYLGEHVRELETDLSPRLAKLVAAWKARAADGSLDQLDIVQVSEAVLMLEEAFCLAEKAL